MSMMRIRAFAARGAFLLAVVAIAAPHHAAFGQGKKKAASPSKTKAANKETDETGLRPASKNPRRKPVDIDGVATFTSRHFIVYTDLPRETANDLLGRLETMLGLISKYWGRPASGTIEMYVVKDVKKWPPGSIAPEGLASVQTGGGVTVSETLSSGSAFLAKAVVYAVADRGTPQHEAVHAYCAQTFGRCGPVWYAEGMAEMGQYWRSDDFSVNAEPEIIDYLRGSEPKSLNEIVNGIEWTGDSWQNYAWRWALCHLLSNNPNYSPRFRALGLGLLTKQDVSFEQTYGTMAKEISFEYRQFLKDVERGYRADLCGWDWKAKFKPVKTAAITTVKIDAGHGWQASRLTVAKGEEYEYSAAGSWTLSKDGKSVDADGNDQGAGRLMGICMTDENGEYDVSEPLELGTFGTFTAPADGNLCLRCRDGWSSLADNKGSVTVKFKLKSKGAPLPPPKGDDKKGAEKPAETGKKPAETDGNKDAN